jgi:hypothetical protein
MKSVVAGATALALAGAGLALAAQASAYTGSGAGGAPSWVPGDTLRKGAVLFYDAAGNQISGGTNIQAIAGYVGTSGTAPRAGATRATAYVAAPDPANANVETWATNNMLGNFVWSPTPGGTPTFSPATPGAFVKLNAAAAAVEDVASGVSLYTGSNTDYKNVLEIRVQDSGVGVVADGGKYWATDIEYNPSTATTAYDGLAPGEWRVVWPAVVSVATTTTTPTVTPSTPQLAGTSLTFSTTVTPASGTLAGGVVKFFDGATQIGANVPFAGNPVTLSTTLAYTGAAHPITAQYVPASGSLFTGSTSGALSVTVNPAPAHATTTTLGSINGGAASVTQPALVTGSAVVTDNDNSGATVTVGSVSFFANGSATPFATDSTGADGFGFSVGSNGFTGASGAGAPLSIVAVYNPPAVVPATFLTSTSGAGTINVIIGILPGNSPDTQYIQTQINPGTVTITTPYNDSAICPTDPITGLPTSPSTCGRLVLPAMTLDSTATGYTTSADFGNISVLDTRPGNLPYDLFANSSDLTRTAGVSALPSTVSVIDSHNVGLTAVALSTLPGSVNNILPSTGNLSFFDNIAADWVQPGASVFPGGHVGLGGTSGQKILHANHGLGTTTIDGTVTIHAPTNTVDGTYAGTITFSAFSA